MLFSLKIFKQKTAILRNAVSFAKIWFSFHSGNQIFTYQVYIFFLWISWIIRIVLSRRFVLFSTHFWILCVLFFFSLSLATFERSSHWGCSVKKDFAKLIGKKLCQSRTETLLRKRLRHRYFPLICTKSLRTPFYRIFPGTCSSFITSSLPDVYLLAFYFFLVMFCSTYWVITTMPIVLTLK